ncbi:hypothetical protein B0O80DRAFT_502225 [Mortierella sp. GBAus27b]|nr:hypothetical protein B0O80DRAFT_502225 [Mortierella sp. GBAus27b]
MSQKDAGTVANRQLLWGTTVSTVLSVRQMGNMDLEALPWLPHDLGRLDYSGGSQCGDHRKLLTR